ncbi:adenine specific DNA methylase Mod [Rivularia sp. PCC 7116]|uniref:DNA methyltransferase n=1 Tax=Rivularia sp. PCC 7116 TaxID=373994 RepID=UPI00029F3EBE|nr:DNA methyltransferase [Rivularia sp. PCC 7116]AFY54360.1 adenine specific DNA methylase Mod [Rivularia sp. PCC 7116]
MSKKTQINTVKHKEKRANIPTEELRDFLSEEEKKPTNLLYSRDISLDPQLVWNTKDEQDKEDLEVSAVPIYIQEKIHPQALIEDFRTQAKQEKAEQLSLFGDFNGLAFEKLIDFYQHKEGVSWTNRMILGDSLSVMASLAEKEGLRGKVQTIYMDPPYGIRFGSNWQVSTRKRDVKDGKAEEATRQPEQVKAFRDTWELGIHSYLSYLRDRLVVARELLTETGSVFVQISDENVHLVRCLMDEVYGRENFCKIIPFQKTSGHDSKILASTLDYLIWYSKNIDLVKFRPLFQQREIGEKSLDRYDQLLFSDGSTRRLKKEEISTGKIPELSKRYQLSALYSDGNSNKEQKFVFAGKTYNPRNGTHWKTTVEGLKRLASCDRIEKLGTVLRYRRFSDDFPVIPLTDRWDSVQLGTQKSYVVETSPKVVERCILMTTDPGDIVLDPTMGSATTAYVAEQWGRRWITIDTSRVALALARTRLMSAQFPYYLLADSTEGIKKETEITTKLPPTNIKTENDIKKGFVYKRVPHITLKAIANNPEIDTIHEKYQQKLEPISTQLNKLLKKKWEEWEIPREPENKWSQEAKDLLQQWWKLRQERQKKIDESIALNSDSEILYDQPYEDKKRLRVTGPFTVESLSPHRVLSTNSEQPASEAEATQQASDQFEFRIIENLRKAGVQNTKKGERLKFDSLEPYASEWIQAEGEYTEKDGTVKRVAVSIGPEYGTVGSDQIKEAAKEAVQGISYDLLIVCGFAFDPGVSEESKRYGKLQVLVTKMNPDLLLGDEVLKKTGSGNLFMVFGEPDIEVQHLDDGKITVELKGLDIYDPTTGEIRSSSINDIACWFIDTNYNGESFFVRHAYFTGANKPYEKLRKTLKAEVDQDAWLDLYSAISRPFDSPRNKNGKPGKIAVKVINHYGDEILKVYQV